MITGQEIAEVACDDTTLPAYVFNDTNLIESPNYPAPYPAYTHCEWIITPDNNVNVCTLFEFIDDKN